MAARKRTRSRARRGNARGAIHTLKFDRCVREVKAKRERVNPYAVCEASIGERGSILPGHRRRSNPRIFRGQFYLILGARPGRMPELVFEGARFGPIDGGVRRGVRFMSRSQAGQFARHLKQRFRGPLRGWELQVQPMHESEIPRR